MRFKYVCDVPIENGDLKGVWTLTHSNGCQNYDFSVVKKICKCCLSKASSLK